MAGFVPNAAVPETLKVPENFAPVSIYQNLLKQTKQGQEYQLDARRGFRILGLISFVVILGGMAAEIASIFATIAGEAKGAELGWQKASVVVDWKHCESMPESDAPATSYSIGVSIVYHVINIIVLQGELFWMARFTARPRATFFISVQGLFLLWLGLGLWSRWVSTLQVAIAGAMIFTGLIMLYSGWAWFWRSLAVSYGLKDKVDDDTDAVDPTTQTADQADKDREVRQAYVRQTRGYLGADGTAM